MLNELERRGAKYFDNGIQKDIFKVFKDYGVNAIRLRIWYNPYDESFEPYGGGTNDFQTTVELAKRAVENNMLFLLNIHYSDFWTDPSKQIKPKAWQNLSGEELEKAVYSYTYDLLSKFKNLGLCPEVVQVGNELTNGLLWPDGKLPDYTGMIRLLKQGISAVRDINKDIKIILHLDSGCSNSIYREWFDNITKENVDFDIIGLSFYPYWHGTLDELDHNMNDISERYAKDVMVVETAYGFTTDNGGENMIFSEELAEKVPFDASEEGQGKFLAELMNRIKNVKNDRGKGFFYWEPEWLPVEGITWATEIGRKYIGDDSSGGNTWSNQALFDFNGNALTSLKVIKKFI